MNRAYLIILTPVILVGLGYVLVLRYMGFAPGYPRLALAGAILVAAMWWLGRRSRRRARARGE